MKAALANAALVAATGLLLSACQPPPVNSVQSGYRGTGMEQVYHPASLAAQAALNTQPDALPPASPDGPKAKAVYQNVKVLGEESVAEFGTMVAITAWVSPKEGCVYCHNAANFADDSKYQKVVGRRMIEMVQHLNRDWAAHVGTTGVTCYTCHRGNPVPEQVWFEPKRSENVEVLLGNKAGQNAPAPSVAMAALPNDPFSSFLKAPDDIRVVGAGALPEGNRKSIKQTEWTYGLMMHMSDALGVNCTFCHNTRSFASWETSSPQRATAWYGIRMVRDLNNDYLGPLTANFPVERLGPNGDVAKVNCSTCHQGAYKPLYGQSLAKAHPELGALKAQVVAIGAEEAAKAVK